jgi:hypothetical protein
MCNVPHLSAEEKATMLDSQTASKILGLTLNYWQTEMATPEFARLASGKEIGHRIADFIDERTTALLEQHFTTRRQYKPDGTPMPRSMGDIWLFSNGMYNPINVKAGEVGKNGQPNMVSLKKLLRALLLHQIDSYYLLIVKMSIKGGIAPTVYLVDLLDYLEYAAFDSGPGQIMLKERQFYEIMQQEAVPPVLTLHEKIEKLFLLLENAERRLIVNRQRVLAAIQKLHVTFATAKGSPIDQSTLNLK